MKGIEKITAKIISEANSEAEAIIKEAEQSCAEIAAEYKKRAAELREEAVSAGKRDGEAIVQRARSSAAMSRRNILLEAEGKTVERAFSEGYEEIKRLPPDKYGELLAGLLVNALREQMLSERQSRELYGEEAEVYDSYELILNKKDREVYGEKIIEAARRKVVGKPIAPYVDKVHLSSKVANIEGGLILGYGDIESNCSIELMFKQIKETKAAEVHAALFEKKE